MPLIGCMKHSLLAVLLFCVTACGASPPPCSDSDTSFSAPSAGCLVVDARGVLLVRDWQGRLALPGGSVARGETARCAAQREVFEETSLVVKAGALAERFDNGFHLFWCDGPLGGKPAIQRPLEVKEAGWWHPYAIPETDWRYPGQGQQIIALLQAPADDADL